MGKRIVGYDIAKCIAMFLVVLIHFSYYTRYYSSGIIGNAVTITYVISVPSFFAVNGALLLPRTFDVRRHYKKTCEIIAIVSVWKLLAAAFCVFVDGSHPVGVKDLIIFLLGGGFGEYLVGYFWFMNALIAVYLVYPLIKLAFDAEDRSVLNCLWVVVFAFSFGKDTVRVILQMLGTASHHDFASVLDGLDQFYIFGNYGYVLIYFITGGLIGEFVNHTRENCFDKFKISPKVELLAVLLCYVVTFAIQRYQHAARGINLEVEDDYWLIPTFIATILVLKLLANVRIGGFAASVAKVVGMNTFGIYMLHMAGLFFMDKLQLLPIFSCLSNLNSVFLELANIAMVLLVFLVCLVASVLLRRIPVVSHLFSL